MKKGRRKEENEGEEEAHRAAAAVLKTERRDWQREQPYGQTLSSNKCTAVSYMNSLDFLKWRQEAMMPGS